MPRSFLIKKLDKRKQLTPRHILASSPSEDVYQTDKANEYSAVSHAEHVYNQQQQVVAEKTTDTSCYSYNMPSLSYRIPATEDENSCTEEDEGISMSSPQAGDTDGASSMAPSPLRLSIYSPPASVDTVGE